MTDIFISFTTRGGAQPWVVNFRESLLASYKSNYIDELAIWDMSKNGPGTNFRGAIDNTLEDTLLFIVVLDPTYTDSPQTLYEIRKYIQARINNNEPILIIKVIKKSGESNDELMKLIDSNILASYFSKKDSNSIEMEFDVNDKDYKYEIERIIKEVRKHKINLENRKTALLIKERLSQLKDDPKIYVAFGDSKLEDNRDRFITQLIDSLKHSKSDIIKRTKVFPDDITVVKPNYQNLSHLLCNTNDYQQDSIKSMINESKLVIIAIENDKEAEAEMLLQRMKAQINEIRIKAINENLAVFILLNIPDALFDTRLLKEEILNPAYDSYSNIQTFRKQDITVFINSCIQFLSGEGTPEMPDEVSQTSDKFVYLIEYQEDTATRTDNPNFSAIREMIIMEKENRAQLIEEIRKEKFDVITNFDIDPKANLDAAIEKHKEWLSMSNGVIIYRGIQEEEDWCKNQQGETFKALRLLNKKNLKRAVYIDPLQPNKKIGSYAIFSYEVLINNPPELKKFLWAL